MAAFDSFFDESESSSLLVIGGLVATADAWLGFRDDWKTALDQHHVSHFHSKTFRSHQSRLYAHLSRDDRRDLLVRLIRAMRRWPMMGLYVSVDINLYNRMTTPAFRGKHGSHYAACVTSAVINVMGHMLTNGFTTEEHASVILESGHKNGDEAIQRLNYYKRLSDPADFSRFNKVVGFKSKLRNTSFRLDAVSLGNKMAVLPLQGADIIAHCAALLKINPDHRWAHPVSRAIAKKLPIMGADLDTEQIGALIESMDRWDKMERDIEVDRHFHRKTLKSLGISFTQDDSAIAFMAPDEKEEHQQILEALGFGPEWWDDGSDEAAH